MISCRKVSLPSSAVKVETGCLLGLKELRVRERERERERETDRQRERESAGNLKGKGCREASSLFLSEWFCGTGAMVEDLDTESTRSESQGCLQTSLQPAQSVELKPHCWINGKYRNSL